MNIIEEFHRQKSILYTRGLDIDSVLISEHLAISFRDTHCHVKLAGNVPNEMFGYPMHITPSRDVFKVIPSYE